jgi:hypothetical protein
LIFSESKKVDARRSLKRAIKFLIKNRDKISKSNEDEALECRQHKYINLNVRRTLEKDSPSIRLENKKQVLTIFPAGKAGEIQEQTISILPPFKKKNDFKIIAESGANSSKKIALGFFEIQGENLDWNVFSFPGEGPIGIGNNIYRIDNNIDLDNLPILEEEICP